ncbi:MAG: hypothetical protein ACI4TK_09345, partial [Agathobacter sp.]
ALGYALLGFQPVFNRTGRIIFLARKKSAVRTMALTTRKYGMPGVNLLTLISDKYIKYLINLFMSER